MGIEDLTVLEIISGILGIIALSISLAAAIKIILKYFEHERHELLTVGFSLFFVSSGYWAAILAFILFVLFDFYFPTTVFFILTYGLQPLTNLFWMYSFGYLVRPKSKWKFVLIFGAIAALYEVYFWYFMFIDPTVIATRDSEFVYINISPVIQLYILFIVIVGVLTVYFFSRELRSAENPKIKLRGKFLFYSMVLISLSTILGIIVAVTMDPFDPTQLTPTQFAIIILGNVLTYLSTIFAYIAWVMPERISKWLIKES